MRLGAAISARPSILLRDYAAQRTLDFDDLAAGAGLDPEAIAEPSAEGSYIEFATLLEPIAEMTEDPSFALGYVRTLSTRPAGVYQTIAFYLETLRDAFRTMSRFLGLVTDALTISYDEHRNSGGLSFRFTDDLSKQRPFDAGQLCIIAVRVRLLLGDDCRPQSVRFTFANPASKDHN